MSSSRRSRRLSPEELMQAVSSLAQYLSQSEAQFSISGGAATSILRMQYGFAQRVTDDIDLVVQPPQYNLDDPDNDFTVISVNGVDVPIFSARWLLREKIVTVFERQGTRKEETDLDDISILLETVDVNELDLTDLEDEVQHAVAQLPESFELLSEGQVYWAFKEQLQYLDADLERHNFDWDPNSQVWYFSGEKSHTWFHDVVEDANLDTAAQNLKQRGFREAPWSYGSRDDPALYTDPKVQQSHLRVAQQYSNLDKHSVRFRFPTDDQAKARVVLLPCSYAHIAVTPESKNRFTTKPQDAPSLKRSNILYPDAELLLESFVRTLVKEPKMGGWVSSLRMWAITHLYGDLMLGDDVLDSCDDEEAKAWFNKRIRRYSGGIDRVTCTKRLGKVGYDENLARKK
ncbi:hypothetical protein MRS44_008588 [Fusarium solani]|uniref:uncharacterized protein n=1 Tax=Fusarium solani TaxID=169388 RepID=UPI0032C49126|nr:hypothetical protein MRS44_008588 [Fusarium solani]